MRREQRRRSNIHEKVKVGCKMIQAADDMPKDNIGSLNILSMIRDTTVRFDRLRRHGIYKFNCGL